jgi:hypothetical protein
MSVNVNLSAQLLFFDLVVAAPGGLPLADASADYWQMLLQTTGSGARGSGRSIRYGCCIALGGTKSFQDIIVNNFVVRAVAVMAESLLLSSSMIVEHLPFCVAICFTLLLANELLTAVFCVAHFTTVSTPQW